MAMSATELETYIRQAFPDAQIKIDDLAGDGDHYACSVVSEAFRGLSRVRQHQLVYQPCRATWAASCMRWRLQLLLPNHLALRISDHDRYSTAAHQAGH